MKAAVTRRTVSPRIPVASNHRSVYPSYLLKGIEGGSQIAQDPDNTVDRYSLKWYQSTFGIDNALTCLRSSQVFHCFIVWSK